VVAIRPVEHLDAQGRSAYARWFQALNAPAAAKVAAAVYQLAAGNLSNVRSVGSGVFERKIDFGRDTASILAVMVMSWWSC
jgi:putative component of toxin-antitoxin plasmid stabilization module